MQWRNYASGRNIRLKYKPGNRISFPEGGSLGVYKGRKGPWQLMAGKTKVMELPSPVAPLGIIADEMGVVVVCEDGAVIALK